MDTEWCGWRRKSNRLADNLIVNIVVHILFEPIEKDDIFIEIEISSIVVSLIFVDSSGTC